MPTPGPLLRVAADVLRGVVDLLYPPVCVLCGGHAGPGQFCDGCLRGLTADRRPTCPRCAMTVGPFSAQTAGCPACRGERFAFERVVRLGPYDDGLREAVLRMKHAGGEVLAGRLGEAWAHSTPDVLRQCGAAVIVPVPLHLFRRLARGYNQSDALARGLARVLDVPCRPGLLRRVRSSPKLSSLSPAARREAVRGAFAATVPARWRGAAVLLVDDVLTTGATASEAARALRAAGSGPVTVAALARAER